MISAQKLVDSMTIDEMKCIIKDYEEYERIGHILEESNLRTIAYNRVRNIRMVPLEMTFIALECYRVFAHRYLELCE